MESKMIQVRVTVPKELWEAYLKFCAENLFTPHSQDPLVALIREALIARKEK